MDIQSLIQEAGSAGISLFLKDGKLGYKTSKKLADRSILGKISERKSHVVAYLEQQNAESAGDTLASLSQKRIWLSEQLQPQQSLFNIPMRLSLPLDVDVKRLQQAITSLVAKHEVLRTCYYELDDEIYQQVIESPSLHIEHHDLIARDDPEQEKLIAQFFSHQFDLGAELPIRACFIKKAQRTELCLLFHHIALDDTACQTFIAQMFDIYAGSTQPPMQSQYRDYAKWQHNHIQSMRFKLHAEKFCEQLRGAPSLHRLPLKSPHSKHTSSTAKTLPIVIPEQLNNKIKALCQEAHITEFSFYHTMLALLVGHWSKTDDVMLGTPAIHRPTASMSDVLGCFLNLMPIRHQLDMSANLAQLLAYIKNKQSELMRYQDVPFEYLLQALKPTRQPFVNPLFQLFVSSHSSSNTEHNQQDWHFIAPTNHASSKYDMTLKVITATEGTKILWQYREDLFSDELMEMMSESFVPMLLNLTRDKEQTLNAALSSIKYPKIAQLTAPALSPKRNLIESIYHHAKTSGQSIAVSCEHQSLNYQSLQTKIEALSQHLVQQGLERGDHIGLMLSRNTNMVIAMLAALRLGLVYIPMDPDYPQQRLAYIAEKGQCRLILKDSDLALNIDLPQTLLNENMLQPTNELELPTLPKPDDLAYIIFTSGSTGQPKGVKINQDNLANFLTSIVTQLNVGKNDRLLAVTPISFDISVLELFAPLMAGGEVVIAAQHKRDGLSLKHSLETQNITLMQATPAGWQSLIDAGWQGNNELTALSGGERLATSLAAELVPKVARLWNMYGPTEATVWATCHPVTQQTQQETPIGQPLGNCAIYILDEFGHPCPPQMRGEIVIAGDCVGQGYVDLESETAERFISIPTAEGSIRAYRTGDLGYVDCNNTLFCLGRNDHQVKVRGFRIELQEIERQLQQLAGLSKVCVVVHTMANGSQKLIAYCASNPETFAPQDLLQQLREILPSYMLPDFMVAIEQLPLTPSGKVDRNYLATIPPQVEEESLAQPNNDTEQQLLTMWQQILNLEAIGTNSNFFALGGDSISAVKLVSQLQQKGFNANSALVFQHQTIKALAHSLVPNSATELNEVSEQSFKGVEVIGDAVSEADLQSLLEEFES